VPHTSQRRNSTASEQDLPSRRTYIGKSPQDREYEYAILQPRFEPSPAYSIPDVRRESSSKASSDAGSKSESRSKLEDLPDDEEGAAVVEAFLGEKIESFLGDGSVDSLRRKLFKLLWSIYRERSVTADVNLEKKVNKYKCVCQSTHNWIEL
jgi:hypothetical protein